MSDAPPPPGPETGTASGPSLQSAFEVVRTLVDSAELSRHECFAVAVVDAHGLLVAFARLDGAADRWVRHAQRKAYTAAIMGRTTRELSKELADRGRTLAEYGDPMITGLPGGVPVLAAPTVAFAAVGVAGNGGAVRDHDLASRGAELLVQLGVTSPQPTGSATR